MRKRLNRITSLVLALVMVFTLIPTAALAAGVNESLVSSLAAVYDGDEERAREELEALYDAGLIDSDGNMVSLDIREDGESVELSEVAQRIADGESVGALTVNGHDATTEQIVQLQQVNAMLEVLRLIDEDVEITDEHVANLESLLEGFADGSIDLSDVISRGGVQLSANRGVRLLGAGNTATLPQNTGSGEVEATDGKYTAPYISDDSYEASHSFALADPENTTWYTDSIVPDAIVTLSCADTATANSTFTVTATLSKSQSFPVSFDWSAVSDVLELTDDTSGTVTWAANDRQLTKTFSVTLGAKSVNWYGSQCFVINAGNLRNAAFEGGKTAWSKAVQILANTETDRLAVFAEYTAEERVTNSTGSEVNILIGNTYTHFKYYLLDIPSDGRFKVDITSTSQYGFTNLHFHLAKSDQTVTDSNVSSVGYAKRDVSRSFTEKVFSSAEEQASVILNNKVYLIVRGEGVSWSGSITVTIPAIATHDEVTGVSVPAGTYYSGQTVPVTVTLKEPAVVAADTTLTVNGVECPLLNNVGTESKTITFGYTVKDTDSGALYVTALDGLKNTDDLAVSLDNGFPEASFGVADGVILSSDVKTSGLDWDNMKCGIDDGDFNDQTVTVVIPFKSGADKTWVTNEEVEINPAVSMSVPGYENAEAGAYLKSAYFSTDGGATRYPVYILGDNADALAVRFVPAMNATPFLRQDILSLYLDTEVGTETNYLGEWADRKEDNKGFAYFSATDDSALAIYGANCTYFVKGCIMFDQAETIDRPGYDESNIMKDEGGNALGFYKDGAQYVVVQGEDYSQQHDVELVANEALYNAFLNGVRVEEAKTLVLNYQISNRKSFTFSDAENFTWSSSDEQIVRVVKNEQTGAGQLMLTGGSGSVTITLHVGNILDSKKYDLTFTFTVLEGKTPYMNIPEFSRERVTLTETDTDVLFASNVTARNASMGTDTTAFNAKLYKVSAVGDEPAGEPAWTASFESTVANTITHITVPGAQLPEAGTYAVVVSTTYVGGVIDGVRTDPEDFSATAYLTVKRGPVKITLNKLDSYSADYNNLSTINYTVTADDAVVQYTIQKSGEKVGERKTATGGTIPFTAEKPEGLKDAYTITVYAKAADAEPDEVWSVDSMLLRVYNMDTLELIVKDVIAGEIGGTTGGSGAKANGTTVTMDNHGKLAGYGITGDSYQLTVSDLNALRTDMSLQKIISVNYGSGVWGLLSDKMQWESSDSDLVSVNYKQGGIYSDINNYSYVSYGPATDFLLVGKDKTDGVTITATHAATNASATLTVAAETLKDQLYVFQFNPKAETDVVYTNGANELRTLKSDENGVLAVYEPEGIASTVMVMAKVVEDGTEVTYVGTIFPSELQSGERDIASLQLYPCNNLRLRSISNATLTFRNPDGSAYDGTVTLRAGVYKNGVYCPGAKAFLPASPDVKYGAQDDITVKVTDGKVTLGFDPTQFKNDPDDANETGAYPTDKITYVIEYRADGYQTSYAMLSVLTDVEGEQKPTDSVVQLRAVRGGGSVPQITRQTIRLYSNGEPVAYTREVTDYTENIGISKKYDKVVLTTDFVLPSSSVIVDAQGRTTLKGEFALYTAGGRKLTGQTEYDSRGADEITELSMLENSILFVFPFSSSPIGRHVYTMTNDNMTADGISDAADNAVSTSRVKAQFVRDGVTLASTSLTFGISNLSHQQELTDEDSGLKDAAVEMKGELKNQMSISEIFKTINVNDMLKKGFAFLGGLTAGGGDAPFSLIILPTEDPGVFRIVAFVGKNQEKNEGNEDGINIEYDAQEMYDDYMDVMEDDDDDDDGGEGSYDVSFSGTLVLEAGYDVSAKKWKIDFRGGKVGIGFSAKYEWSQNFMCGPIPTNISFEVGANAVLEVSFASKSSVKLMLVDATIGVYVEAFAGLGFDASIAKLKLGIYGRIGADVNFLLLSDFKKAPSTGTKLTINGEIGIRLEVKLLFIKYNKTFASTGFSWTKKWNQYDSIQSQWKNEGFADLFGFTQSGRAYSMRLLSNGTAIVTVDGGGEIEDRDYLKLAERTWNSGVPSGRRLMKAASPLTNALTNVQTNAYPYANPVLTDDGSMFLYISDNNNSEEVQSVVSYAVKNGSGYDNMGALDEDDTVFADSDVVASGTGSDIFTAWVKQQETPTIELLGKSMGDAATYDDLGMMMNATEVYAGVYKDSKWIIDRLTTNNVADMSPTVASSGNRAIVAWRSLSATNMPEEDGAQDISTMFNAENNVNYRIYNGSEWTTAQVAYNGTAGTVNAIDSAMLSDGTAILVYTVRTGEDVTTTETFYTVIGTDGAVITTGRLTNDSYTDTNAQVTAVADQFLLGWYSEHETGEKTVDPDTKVEEDVVAHDIRLARVNANGSVDESFPESIGGGSASAITSDFRFSAPANNEELKNVSIVWSQRKDSENAYELNAVRFYETTGANPIIGVTAQNDIAKTGNNVTVDRFDTYTDASGKVYILALASDYSSVDGIEVFDRIDLTNLPLEVGDGSAEPSSETLTILEQNPIAAMMLGSGSFPENAIEVTANTNLRELVPGLDLPVQFAVKNTGASTINNVTVTLGGVTKSVEDISLLPNESTIITLVYPVPEDKVEDVDYTVTADGAEETGTLVLNRPDVGISGMKLLSEENGERIVQVTLTNASGIPLKGSGKTVKLGLYKTSDHDEEDLIGEVISIADAKALADIDDGIYGAVQTIDVESLIDGAEEIPEEGIRLYAYAWVEDCVELYKNNNEGTLGFKGLLTKNNGEKLTIETAIDVNTVNDAAEYTVHADIRNNSMQEHEFGVPVVVLLDSEGNKLAEKNLQDTPLVLGKEERRSDLSVSFTADEVGEKTPAQAIVRHIMRVSFDVNGGSGEFAAQNTDLEGHIELPSEEPASPIFDPPVYFNGWYTEPTNGKRVTNDYTFTESTTIYAQYKAHEHSLVLHADGDTVTATCVSNFGDCTLPDGKATLTIVAPQRATTGYGMPDATITGATELLGTPLISYYTATESGTRGSALTKPSGEPGKYWAEFTIGEGENSVTAHLVYEIPTIDVPEPQAAVIPNFVKITDASALDDMTACTGLEAAAWLYANEARLNKEYPYDNKYIIYRVDYMPKPDYYPEDAYWPYEEGTKYASYYQLSSEWCDWRKCPASELVDIISNRWGKCYIPGSDSTLYPVDVNFTEISSQDELSSMNPSTRLDALAWILAQPDAQSLRGIFALEPYVDEWSSETQYRYIAEYPGEPNFGNGYADNLFSWPFPVYTAEPAVVDPTITHDVTYDANGGSGTTVEQFYIKSTIALAGDDGFSRTGYRFVGWNTAADGSGVKYAPGDAFDVNEDVTFYAQWEHVHSWHYGFDEDSSDFTATCVNPGCTLGELRLHAEAVDKVYDGKNAEPYTCSEAWTAKNGLAFPELTFYSAGQPVAEGKDVGTYAAVASLAGHEVEVSEFSITPRPVVIIADDLSKFEGEKDPELTVSYDSVGLALRYENDETYPWFIVNEGGRTYVKSGNGGKGNTTSTLTLEVTLEEAGEISFDYTSQGEGTEWTDWDFSRFYVDNAEKLKSNAGPYDWQTYSCELSAGTHTLKWTFTKDSGTDAPGDCFTVDNVVITTDGAVTQAEPEEKPDDTAPFEALIADLLFKKDANYPWQEVTDGDRTYAQSGNGGQDSTTSTLKLDVTLEEAGTLSFDYNYGSEYSDKCYFRVDGKIMLEKCGEGDGIWKPYSCELSAGSHTLTWSYEKDWSSSYNGDFFAVDNIVIATEGDVTQPDPNLALIRALGIFEGGIVEGETLNYTVSYEDYEEPEEYPIMVPITVTLGENPNYDVREVREGTLTVLEPVGTKQTIALADMTVTYGDTNAKLNASITEGDGTLSYKIKSGDDVVAVDQNGNLTILKTGTAVITVVASKTDNFLKTTKSVTVTVEPKPITDSTRAQQRAGIDGQPHGITVTVTDPAEGYTVKYGTAEGMYNLTTSPTLTEAGTLTVYYQVTADNYVTCTGSATLTLVNHTHELTYTVGTGENANTITATCSEEDCYLENHTATLTIAATENNIYTGDPIRAIIFDENSIQGDAKVLYATMDANGVYGDPVETVPVNVGTYRASITLGEGANAVTAYATYTIEKADPTAAAPSPTATYGQALANVTLTNPDGNTAGTWTWAGAGTTSVGDAGSNTFKANFTPTDIANYKTVENVDVTVTVGKADATDAMKKAFVNLAAKESRTAEVSYVLPDGADYGSVTNGNTAFFAVSTDSGLVLTAAKTWTENDWATTTLKTFTVEVNGATNYNDYTLTVSVTPTYKPEQVIAIAAEDVTAAYGDTGLNINASITTGDGTLSYKIKSGDAVTVDASGNLTIVKAGIAIVTVTAAETATYAMTTKDVTVTVNRKALTITAGSGSKAYDGTPLTNDSYTNTALISGDSIESVTVTGTQTYVGSSSNVPNAAVIKRGETDVTANYDISYVNGTLTITNRDAKYEITVTANSGESKYDGTEKAVRGFETLSFTFNNVNYTVSGLTAEATGTDAGSYTVAVTGTAVVKDDHDHDLTDQFIVNTVNGSMKINKRSVTLTSATKERQYNGSTLTDGTVTVGGEGWATGEGATYDVTGAQKLVGSSVNAFTYTLNDGTKADNYNITTSEGTLTVTSRTAKYEVSPQAKSDTVKYDGQSHTVTGFVTDSFTVDDNTYTVSGLSASATGTDAGSYTVSVNGAAMVMDSDGKNVTDQFSVTPQTGTLSITKREVTLASATDSKEYDGTALTNNNVTVTGDGFATSEGADYDVTGTRTLVGTSDNTFTYALNDGTKADNYTITTNNGTLTVNNRNTRYAVTLKANSGEFLYDGTEKTVSGWTINDVSGGSFTAENGLTYTVTGMEAELKKTDAGSYDVTVTGTPEVKDAAGNAVTEQFSISVEKGTLTINKRSVTLTSATDSKAYNGTALTNSEVTVSGDGFAEGEGATYNVTGSQTLPESSANAFTYTLNEGTKAENYEITKTEGTLTITNRNDEEPDKKYEITVKANSSTVTYDGQPHTVSGFETLEYTFNGVTYTVSGLTATATKTNAGTYTAEIVGTPVVKDGNNNVLTEQFIVNKENGTLKINKAVIEDEKVALETFTYDGAVSAPVITGTLVGGDDTKNVTYYYQATAFLKSQTDDISKLDTAEGVYKTLTPTTFDVGTHYVLAVVTGDNYSNVPYVTQSVFEVKQNTDKERTAPAAPTVDGDKATVAEADREKSLEYSLDGQTWLPVELDENGGFTAEWANPVTNADLKLRETADERYAKPSASATGTAAITTTTFTVTYDANGGVKAPDAVTVTSDRTVTVSGKANMTRKGYTFTEWNTKADGTGTAYKAGDKLDNGTTLYAQWEANTYKVRFSSNGGKGTMEELEFTYDDDAAKTLTANAFSREEYVFLGWSLTASGSVQYQDKQSVKNIAESGNITLYAVWAKYLYNVSGAIKSAHTGNITLQLVQGNNTFGELETVEYDTANSEKAFKLNGVPAGTYNLVAKQGDVTVTAAVIITDDHVALEPITMPTGNTSSVVDVKSADAPAIVVGGLDGVAAAEEIDDRKVTVTIAIETQNEADAGEAGEAIVKESRASNIEFMDFTVTKTIYNGETEEAKEQMTETKSLIELVIPFDFSGKAGIKLYRYHDGDVQELKQANGEEAADGTYKLDSKNGLIYVYSSKFSTYAISHTIPTYSGYSPATYANVVSEAENGKVTADPAKPQSGAEVTVTATPDEGYEVDTVTITDANGKSVEVVKNEDGTYTFTQPSSKVTITPIFKAIEKLAQMFFVDVPEDSYYYDAVKWAVENGITQGTSDTTFSPNASCTRAQMVTFIWRAVGKPEPAMTNNPFTDLDENAYYYKAVLWAYENGITLGTSTTTFSPEITVTRSQSVTFLFRALSGKAGKKNPFTDVKDGAYYYDAVLWAAENGITLGTSETTFSPDNDCLRAQIVTFLYRAYN